MHFTDFNKTYLCGNEEYIYYIQHKMIEIIREEHLSLMKKFICFDD